MGEDASFCHPLRSTIPHMSPESSLRDALLATFSFKAFRPGQEEASRAIFEGRDLVTVMPTGFGKSLCYQLPATLLEGTTVVISPLIALMKDQVDALKEKGIPAEAVHSGMPESERDATIRALAQGNLKLIYAAPERLGSPRFQRALARAGVTRMIVDEAHCISQWGHDFRPDYRRLGPLRQQLSVPAAAFTATATPDVRADISVQLGLENPLELVTGFERPNLTFGVRQVRSWADKERAIREVLAEWGSPGLIYGATRKSVEKWADFLAARGLRAACYHGGVGDRQREAVQDAFLSGQLDAISATNAFGMGIDKADIRFVIHAEIPGSVEAYYQEAGRAGRDGRPSLCLLLFAPSDIRTQEFFLAGSNPSPALFRKVWSLLANETPEGEFEVPGELDAAQRMAAATAARLLRQEAGRRGIPPGNGPLPLDLGPRHEKAARDRRRLDAMLSYAFGQGCRTHFVYDYFAGSATGGHTPNCGTCDVCLGWTKGRTRPLEDQEFETVRIALSGVARLDGRFGQERIAQLLTGSRSHELVSRNLHLLPTWGRLSSLSLSQAKDLLSALVDGGLVERRRIQGGPAGAFVLALTHLGIQTMKGELRPAIAFPNWQKTKRGAGSSGTKTSQTTKTRTQGSGPGAHGLAPGAQQRDVEAFERLREWRGMEAHRRRIPAYCVLTDATLLALADTRPANPGELLEVPGIGQAKLKKYGTKLIELLERLP